MQRDWIKVDEKLPDEKELVLLYNQRHAEQHIGWLENEAFNWGDSDVAELEEQEISHWQPLPDDPETE